MFVDKLLVLKGFLNCVSKLFQTLTPATWPKQVHPLRRRHLQFQPSQDVCGGAFDEQCIVADAEKAVAAFQHGIALLGA